MIHRPATNISFFLSEIPPLFVNSYLPPLCLELLKCRNQIFSLTLRDLWQSLTHRIQRVSERMNKCYRRMNTQINGAPGRLITFEVKLCKASCQFIGWKEAFSELE